MADEGLVHGACRERSSTGAVAKEPARLICGRRTAEQVRSYRWDGDPEPLPT